MGGKKSLWFSAVRNQGSIPGISEGVKGYLLGNKKATRENSVLYLPLSSWQQRKLQNVDRGKLFFLKDF